MKTIQKIGFLVATIAMVACGDNEAKGGLEQLQNLQEPVQTTTTNNYTDSIQSIKTKIGEFQASSLSKKEQINFLIAKRDSIKGGLDQIEMSLQKVNNDKIAPGISGVNSKLNELKGQKENLEEQMALQHKELGLAEKKVVLLKEEKEVYDAQKKALYDKGAAPEDFVTVDTLLSDINDRLQEQASKIKNLNRSVSDILEQVASIEVQRNSLSTKIRSNYTAKQIFEDFSKEEKDRLGAQLLTVDEQLKLLVADEDELKKELLAYNNGLTSLKNKQDISLEEAEKTAKEITDNADALQQKNLADKDAIKKNRIIMALTGIGVLAVLFAVFYFIGKKRKAQKTNI
ncbi:hypothetical protein I2486_13740 [Cellulophaga sp. E16_2]|uniref:hypothetical protein n=1 Tax=Cellulophaga sp. E16_2 TaxID=2789297 RepID=UPI001A92E4B9|nr:hypothetical protein [Cellulophaga sp. E16_2]MBO0592464.1 hypothetical protein [Cellulophaga sp. E16_2]